MPKISIIIPTYNGSKYISSSINSVLNQTYKDWELIIIDDGSTDNTESVVKEIIGLSPLSIRYIKQENRGPNAARNVGLTLSAADFVAFLDSDDVWLPEKLEKQISLFNTYKNDLLGVVYCEAQVINDKSVVTNEYLEPLDRSIHGNIYQKLFYKNYIMGSASGVLVKRSCFDAVGKFDEKLRGFEDWDMWLRIAEKYEYDFVPEILVKLRHHYSNNHYNLALMFLNGITFYNKWCPKVNSQKIFDVWAERIVFDIIRGFPKNNLLLILKQKISQEAKEKIFNKTHGSVRLFIIYFFCIRFWGYIIDPKKIKKIYLKTKEHILWKLHS